MYACLIVDGYLFIVFLLPTTVFNVEACGVIINTVVLFWSNINISYNKQCCSHIDQAGGVPTTYEVKTRYNLPLSMVRHNPASSW